MYLQIGNKITSEIYLHQITGKYPDRSQKRIAIQCIADYATYRCHRRSGEIVAVHQANHTSQVFRGI